MSRPNLDDVDFDAIYRGEPLVADAAIIPWDISGPQPRLVELADAGEISGEVLDVGCGLGDNALFLASRGYRVSGIDAAPTAIAKAGEKARSRGLDAEFIVADATKLEGFTDRFDTVIDSALYHCLNEEEQRSYVAALHRACRPAATLHLFSAADELTRIPIPHPANEQSLRASFSQGWRITRLEHALYSTAVTLASVERLRAAAWPCGSVGAATRTAPATDPQGRFQMPIWHLTATRVP